MPRQPRPSVQKRARAYWIHQTLERLYPETPIPLDHSDPYTLLIAVLLSAQCTDARVNTVTPRLFELARTPEAMKDLSKSQVLQIIKPCGLGPQKSNAIVELSKILCERFQGRVPNDLEALESLPGVGHKTAQVVVAQAFGVPAFPVDTHIHRLSRRWKLSPATSVLETERDLKSIFPEQYWNKLHLRIIFFGREHCTARGCSPKNQCLICKRISSGVEFQVAPLEWK